MQCRQQETNLVQQAPDPIRGTAFNNITQFLQ
jgi:hypothetical protein